MTDPRCCLMLTTVADMEQAQTLAGDLIAQRLAACVNIIPEVVSVYEWHHQVHQDAECQLLIKTTPAKVDAINQWLNQHHPYELPECLVIDVNNGSEAFIQWLQQQVSA